MGNKPSANEAGQPPSFPGARRKSSLSVAGDKMMTKITRSPSGADILDKYSSNLVPIEKLSKILLDKTRQEYNINGIKSEIFVVEVFSAFPELGMRIFRLLHINSKATTNYLGVTAFRQQCERFLSILDDAVILETCVKMYSDTEGLDHISPSAFRSLLKTCFDLTTAHLTDSTNSCPMIDRTLDTVVKSCFFSKDTLSPGFICRWLDENCPRLVPPLYKYCVFILTSAYRGLAVVDNKIGLELATPVLEKACPFTETLEKIPPLLPVSEAWLLAGTLNVLYSMPQQVQSPTLATSPLASTTFMANLISIVPSHWTLLYDSSEHGVGANRFLHHVTGYKGPTLVLLRGNDDHIFCISAPTEWRETNMFTGGDHCSVIQLSPKFCLIEKGPKMLYLNTSTRGYPKGLRAGSDPRKPIISVDENFAQFEYRGVPYTLISIEVWGCGDSKSRHIQMDIKKWQIKEAERQRTVKLTAADWIDHPDRYLLELGGRANYNNSAN